MYFTTQQILSLTEESLRNFLSLAIPEGLYLDYKESLSGTSDKEAKREFLKDITAFANAAGGDIIFGVKEPSDGLTRDNQLVGLDNGEAQAQDLERLASASTDPRIPGLRIVRVPLVNTRSCIIVHIPPSLSRPHMVNHAGHRSFYIRHSESSFPMTTHEVREAVITSASAEARARFYVERRLAEVREILGDQLPAFFLQAVPLIAPESQWAVLNESFENVLRGNERYKRYPYYSLASNIMPRPTIDGLLGTDSSEQPTWETEVHRTGYVSAFYQDIRIEKVGNVDRYVVHSGYCDLFRAFCDMLKELLNVSGTDVPYLVTCTYLNAAGTCVWTESRRHTFSKPYTKRNIVWPEHMRSTGEDPMAIADSLCTEMFNAFGFKAVIK